MTNASGTPFVTSAPAGYGPSDLLSAYNLATAAAQSGTGQTVALVDAYDDPNAESDLGTYRSEYGLAACTTANGCFRKVNQTGGTSYPTANASWSEEISLDLDMVSAVCPNCHILLVEANSNSLANLGASDNEAVALGATQVSNSYGGSEYSSETSDQSTYFNHPGVAITASSGDNGYGVEFPAASQDVTAVGGTSLTQDTSTPRGWTETAWSGAGSGCSSYIQKPSWQTDTGCTKRTVADVSADADPNTGVAVYDSYGESGWLVFGGTSVASPIIASTYALIGSAAAADYGQYPYLHPTWFNDVTSGSNGSCGGSYLCTAVVGYDGPTGIGTPAGVTHPPVVSTGSASGVGTSTATLAGSVNPDGQATTYHFDYGTSNSYGSQAPAPPDPSAGSGTTNQNETANLTGLSSGTTYHYRIEAKNSFGTTYGSDQTFTTSGPTISSAPQGSWVGTYGSSGYDLAAWSGQSDLTEMPGVSVNLVKGSRWVWASNTSDVRALQNPSQSSRTAATFYDPSQVQVQLGFSSAYTGNLELYAADWDSQGRTEKISVGSQTASLSDFSQGEWVVFPITQAANSTLTITVSNTGPVNAVLSGIFLGGAGSPPSYPSAPQGSWAGTYGASGYDLAGWNGASDVTVMPGVSASLVQGSRYTWAQNTSDSRALQSADKSTRNAATFYDSNQVQVQLNFSSAYSGNLELYAVDWDSGGRVETITVGGQTATLSNFSQGAWVSFPISQAASSTLTITVSNAGPVNAVLSGIFLGGAGAPPSYPSAPQGSWVGTYGASGYDLAAWNGGSDVTEMPGVSVNLVQGSRYLWASGTSDGRALQSADKSTRNAATYYDPNQVQVQLTFSSAYSGNLELYAVDWDARGRRETITVGNQVASLAGDFSQGAWITFPISVSAGGSITITVDRNAGDNAVLSGLFLN